jgi:hypothetical protein
MGGLRRLKTKLNVKEMSELLSRDAEASGVPILYEALLDKKTSDGVVMTEDQFADLLPAHLEDVIKTVALLMGASFPDRPPVTSPTEKTETVQ